MAFSAARTSVGTTAVQLDLPDTAKNLLVAESLLIQNTDASATVYIGGSAVASSTGFPLVAGASLPVGIRDGETVWAVAASGTVNVAVLYQGV